MLLEIVKNCGVRVLLPDIFFLFVVCEYEPKELLPYHTAHSIHYIGSP